LMPFSCDRSCGGAIAPPISPKARNTMV